MPIKINERTTGSMAKRPIEMLAEDFDDYPLYEFPPVIFPEIRAITADSVTRNYTLYPAGALMGDPNEGTGFHSLLNPYPIPILRDHLVTLDEGADPNAPFGRVINASYVTDSTGGWIRAVPVITDPKAIAMILDQRFMTVSIGGEVSECYCSVCTANGDRYNMIEQGFCNEHWPGETYDGVLCYWEMGGMKMYEISFVNVPADENARVVTPDLGQANSISAYIPSEDGNTVFNLSAGERMHVDDFCSASGISRAAFTNIMESARKSESMSKLPGHMLQRMLDDESYLVKLRSIWRGHR